jgi:hypothetical protein
MISNSDGAKYLQSLGFTDVEDYGGEEICFIDYDGYSRSIFLSEFDTTSSAKEILCSAVIYSCCGDVVNKDYMICPSCKEHI